MKTLSREIIEEKSRLDKSSKKINFLSGFGPSKKLFYFNGQVLCSDFSLATGYNFFFNPPVFDENLSDSEKDDFFFRNYYPTRVMLGEFRFYSSLQNFNLKKMKEVENFKAGFDNSIFNYVEYNDDGGKEGIYPPKWYKKQITFLQTQEQILSSLKKFGVQEKLINRFENDLSEIYSSIQPGCFSFNKALPNLDYLIKTKFQKSSGFLRH